MPRVEWCTAGASVWKELQVRALPRSGWAAAGMLLFASAACAVADPPPTGSPAPPSSFLTGVPTEPTKTKARVLPSPGAGVLPTTEAGVLPTLEAGVLPSPGARVLPTPEKPQRTVRPPAPKKEKATVPQPDHIVVVILENKHRSSVIGSRQAPYLNKLAAKGANMTQSYGVTHPSQPNYLALFSGLTRGVRSNACPRHFRKADNLGHQLRKSGLSFIGYSESLPKTGFRGCTSGRYVRKHNPWVNFATLPASTNRPFSAFPRDYRNLPTVAFVSPNMCHGMHDCSVRTGDRWMKRHFDRYARWAERHNSLLIVTFDENAGGKVKPIFTIIVGANVRPGAYGERLNHYRLLRTIEEAYGLPPLGRAKGVRPLSTIWTS
jgi:Phosphoesterase family